MKFVLKNAEELIAAGFLIITTALVVLNIICRYFFNMGMVWSEEVATGCFVWSVFIGAIACFKRRGHVGVDIVVNMLPPALRRGIATLMDIILVVLNAYMFYLSVVFISKSYTKLTPVMGISSAYITTAVVIAFFMMTIYSVIFVYEDFCGYYFSDTFAFPKHHQKLSILPATRHSLLYYGGQYYEFCWHQRKAAEVYRGAHRSF